MNVFPLIFNFETNMVNGAWLRWLVEGKLNKIEKGFSKSPPLDHCTSFLIQLHKQYLGGMILFGSCQNENRSFIYNAFHLILYFKIYLINNTLIKWIFDICTNRKGSSNLNLFGLWIFKFVIKTINNLWVRWCLENIDNPMGKFFLKSPSIILYFKIHLVKYIHH
jgi:hypothetical protein